MNYTYGPWYGNWNNGAFIGFHIFGMLVFLALVFLVIRYCLHGRVYSNHGIHNGATDASNIAKVRYAKGEIKKEELDKILNDIK